MSGEYDEDKHPRGEHGKWSAGGGGGASAHHEERMHRAKLEAHANFQGQEHTPEAAHAATSWQRSERSRIAAEELAHGGLARLREAGERGHAEHVDLVDAHHSALGAITREREYMESEHAVDHAISSGRLTSEARDIARDYATQHDEHQRTIDAHIESLHEAHRAAADALEGLHSHASEEMRARHSDLAQSFNDSSELTEHAGRSAPDRTGVDYHYGGRVTSDHIADEGALKSRAEAAQSALERLHELQGPAHESLRGIDKESGRAEKHAQSTLDRLEGHSHVNEGVLHDDEARAEAERLSEEQHANAARHVDTRPSHDVGFAASQIRGSQKLTAAAIRHLSKITGRAPRITVKPRKSNRPDSVSPANVWGMAQPSRYRLRLSKLDFLSLVDVPAQETAQIRLIKRKDSPGEIEIPAEFTARILKISDGDDPLIYCWAFTTHGEDGQPYHDLQGDAVTEFIKAAEAWLREGGAVDEMHDSAQKSRVAFAFPMDADIAKAMFGAKAGELVKSAGLMVAIRPTADQLEKARSGKYTGVSIAGTGVRELVKSTGAKCAACDKYGSADDKGNCPSCGKAMAAKSVSPALAAAAAPAAAADRDALPDSSFLYVEAGVAKDAEGKTPRSSRHFPYKDAVGKVDLPQLRAAIDQIPQSSLPAAVRDKLQVHAEKLLGKQHGKRVAKQAVLTSVVDGHQHSIDLDDPADSWDPDQLSLGYATAEGADAQHTHPWTYDAEGKIAIGTDSGHTHTVDAVVPADVIAEAADREDSETCPRCHRDCEEGDSYCSGCGAELNSGAPKAQMSDDDSESGPTVIAISMRAAQANSSPSDTTHTVKNKEPDAMADNDTIRALQAENALLKSMATLTDAQRAHHNKLIAKGVKSNADAFLALTPAQRDTELSELAKADEVVYTSKSHGRVYRKSDALEIIEAAREFDAMADLRKRLETERTELEFSKRGDATLVHFAKGGKQNLRGRIMKAVAAEFTDPAEYAEAERAMKAADFALGESLSGPKGVNPHVDAATDASPQAQLTALVKRHASENKTTEAKAYAVVLGTPEGAALYGQIPTARA